jgi:2-polyprenyl-3-methyl-5-hydroxy-6-metoxy-1,4-benzoquinol methylase
MRSDVHSDPAGLETLEIFSGAPEVNRWLFDKINGFLRGEILEIGSGIGNISGFLLSEQSAVYLSDLRQEYCLRLEKKFHSHPHLRGIYHLDLSLPDFKTRYSDLLETFDTVITLNVVEHIQDDQSAIENAKTLLRIGGKLIVLVPAIPGLYNSLDRHLGHFRRYTKTELRELIEKTGLKFGGCRYFNAAAIPGWWYSGSLLKEKIVTPSKLRFFNRMVPLFRIIDPLLSPFTGISLITSGIKNIN